MRVVVNVPVDQSPAPNRSYSEVVAFRDAKIQIQILAALRAALDVSFVIEPDIIEHSRWISGTLLQPITLRKINAAAGFRGSTCAW